MGLQLSTAQFWSTQPKGPHTRIELELSIIAN